MSLIACPRKLLFKIKKILKNVVVTTETFEKMQYTLTVPS